MTLVVDASALVEYLIGSSRALEVSHVIRAPGTFLHTPALCDVEVASSLRQLLRRDLVTEPRAREILTDYLDLPLARHGHQTLLARIISLRESFSAYDAAYIALAERLGGTLVTADERLGRAIESHLELEVTVV